MRENVIELLLVSLNQERYAHMSVFKDKKEISVELEQISKSVYQIQILCFGNLCNRQGFKAYFTHLITHNRS